ncbi:KilA-N domain-containing protein [Vreelandella indica]|uniref:KilA-N domain-containing protein n=1 Tax=Vreelandella indica TaxID=3126500 RepID=UPI00300E5037
MINAMITKQWHGKTLTFREDGYFNMTKAAKEFGKEVKEFLRLPSTKEYTAELEKVGYSHVFEVKRGRHGGTWAHPKLAVFFARWLDVRFAVACDGRPQSIRFL